LEEAEEICDRTIERLLSLDENEEAEKVKNYKYNLPTEEEYSGF